uniref:Uncharacterized protein n=1 Tax=Molossus molossus TaxID=27622 RepID=A0A7J8I176_MOLMO|nr:hypothetical protein HJG59_010901 [Molossus molossus]
MTHQSPHYFCTLVMCQSPRFVLHSPRMYSSRQPHGVGITEEEARACCLGKSPKDAQPRRPIGLNPVGGLPGCKISALKPLLCRSAISKCAGRVPGDPQKPFQGVSKRLLFQLPTLQRETTRPSVLQPKQHAVTDTRQKRTREFRRLLLNQTSGIRKMSTSVFSPVFFFFNLENVVLFHKRNIYAKMSRVPRFKIK